MRGGPRGFNPGFTCPDLLRNQPRESLEFRLRDSNPLRPDVPVRSTTRAFCNSPAALRSDPSWPYNPAHATPAGFHVEYGLGCSPFARHYSGNRDFLSVPPGTQMCHFPGFPPPALCVQTGVTRHDPCRVSPFGHPRINAWLAAPRGLSQPPTSFIGFWRLGIHRVPFVTWQLQRCSRSLCSSQGSRLGSRTRLSGRAGRFGIRAEPRGEVLAPPR